MPKAAQNAQNIYEKITKKCLKGTQKKSAVLFAFFAIFLATYTNFVCHSDSVLSVEMLVLPNG